MKGFLAKVSVYGQVFESSQVRTKKVDAEQDAAKLAFEHLHQQQQSDDMSDTSKNDSDHVVQWFVELNLVYIQQC